MMDRSEYFKQKSEERKNTHKRIQVTLTISQYKEFEKIAHKEEVSVSKLLSNMAIAYRDKSYFYPKEILDSLSEFNRSIRGVANNLNQLSKSSNIFKEVDKNLVFNHLKELDKKISNFIKGKF